MRIVIRSLILLEDHFSLLLHLRKVAGFKPVEVLFPSDGRIEDEWAHDPIA